MRAAVFKPAAKPRLPASGRTRTFGGRRRRFDSCPGFLAFGQPRRRPWPRSSSNVSPECHVVRRDEADCGTHQCFTLYIFSGQVPSR